MRRKTGLFKATMSKYSTT